LRRISGEWEAALYKMIVIIGAGICGLATAYELSRRGAQAIVIERGEPFAEQSAGLARIFRIAHQRPEL
jgi:glycine/D-amino acid oxidase-like deaminating enzyme